MAFVLVALLIFFSMVALIYASLRISHLKGQAGTLAQAQAQELARTLASAPELQGKCDSCIDTDKALILKEKLNSEYKGLWKVSYLRIERLYPNAQNRECTRMNYPDCSTLTLINGSLGTAQGAFVNLCRYVAEKKYIQCDIGKIYVSLEAP
ncbi:hypothetical protein KW805_04580 [Candidatus Pacearchaeota archaeon]|nr:hypothetical protein [Candidatus Pacearchaeota archaeon]